jgi:hypothetical protein
VDAPQLIVAPAASTVGPWLARIAPCAGYSWPMQIGSEPSSADRTVGVVIARALAAYRALGELGESIADEWQYVNDLVAVHSADLLTIVAADFDVVLSEAAAKAVDVAIEEIGLITDPHRAIDWLSTFPQIVRLAVTPPAGA